MNRSEALYNDYWNNQMETRGKRKYYERLYSHLSHKFIFQDGDKIADIAGGNGHNLMSLGITSADVFDISDSGLAIAQKNGFGVIKADIHRRFPVEEESYDAAICFEVLEHLHFPNKTLSEINNILKPNGILYVAQPNMRPDGVIHVRRYSFRELIDDLEKSGFSIVWSDYVPAYTMRDSILSDIKKNPSWVRKVIQCVNLTLSYLPWRIRYQMAVCIPNRFALMFVVKAIKT